MDPRDLSLLAKLRMMGVGDAVLGVLVQEMAGTMEQLNSFWALHGLGVFGSPAVQLQTKLTVHEPSGEFGTWDLECLEEEVRWLLENNDHENAQDACVQALARITDDNIRLRVLRLLAHRGPGNRSQP